MMYSFKVMTVLFANFIISQAQADGYGGDIVGELIEEIVGEIISYIFRLAFQAIFKVISSVLSVIFDILRSVLNICIKNVAESLSISQTEVNQFLQQIFFRLILMLSFLAVFLILIDKNKRIAQIYAQQVSKTKATCTLNSNEKKQLINDFQKKKWRIECSLLKKQPQFMSCQMKLLDTNFTDIYQISIEGEDLIGKSRSSGVLYLQNNYLCLKFKKVYNNRIKAGQTGSFTDLIYEGKQQGDEFYGEWYYKGHKSNPKFSGNWSMSSQKHIIDSIVKDKKQQQIIKENQD